MANALIVDDSASMRMVIKVTLNEAGYDVIEAEDGSVGLKKALLNKFDVIFTDINMPGMNGYDFIKKMRALPDYEHTPIITITTESGDEEKAKGKGVGATGWIVKPFSPEKLVEVMKKLTL
ncbi:MAG: response regulator [Gammaproteobacteria bacterium]|nr:response regulator [Gammaproteobacteria bacterium]